jgi:hypothetical protein
MSDAAGSATVCPICGDNLDRARTRHARDGERKQICIRPPNSSFGYDFKRVDNSSLKDCTHSDCNAFIYNQRNAVCFLKRSANRALAFYALSIKGVKLSPSGLGTATGGEVGNYFVIIPRADSPGNDYFRVTLFTLKGCQRSCEADKDCNAFTYNEARSVCFLKRAANQWT